PHLTIEENLALAYTRKDRKPFRSAVRKQEKDLFRTELEKYHMDLENRMKTKVGLLSGGQRQVVTLLMCTLVMPKLLLLDEHTAALDPATADKVMEITRSIVSENHLTTLMITHNLSQALTTGNRTIMLDEGRIILDLGGEERAKMGVNDLLDCYAEKKKKAFDNDRMMLAGTYFTAP
ncbi:ATP-binding cassette domain-containing protein, partial [Clostridium sp.]